MLPKRGMFMQTSRRTFLSAVTVATAAAATPPAAKTAAVKSGPNFYVAAVTPCDSKLKLDEPL
jgi:hypothetical protein